MIDKHIEKIIQNEISDILEIKIDELSTDDCFSDNTSIKNKKPPIILVNTLYTIMDSHHRDNALSDNMIYSTNLEKPVKYLIKNKIENIQSKLKDTTFPEKPTKKQIFDCIKRLIKNAWKGKVDKINEDEDFQKTTKWEQAKGNYDVFLDELNKLEKVFL